MYYRVLVAIILCTLSISCTTEPDDEVGQISQTISRRNLVEQVRGLVASHELKPLESLPIPDERDELYELGRRLAFDKVLSGTEDVACLTCHHPALETDDNRALPLGAGGDGLGLERIGGTLVPRNAPALFNLHTLPEMFWDGRARIGEDGTYITPINSELPDFMAEVFRGNAGAVGSGVVGFQAMFPVTSRSEMRGHLEQSSVGNMPDPVEGGADAGPIWMMLMAKLGAIPEYVERFEKAYPGTAFEDMNFAHAANAIGVYQMVAFKSDGSPWENFLAGDDEALSTKQLRGATAFFENGCANCHSGSSFSDGQFWNIALPQFGPGKGNGPNGDDDFGRENVTHDPADRYTFRTPPLVNIELSAPYGHAGQYSTLEAIIKHYHDPEASLMAYDIVEHVSEEESYLWSTQINNQAEVLARLPGLVTDIHLGDTPTEVDQTVSDIAEFLRALTDPTLDLTTPETVPSGLPVDGIADNVGSSVKFEDITADAGVTYRRARSPREDFFDTIKSWPQYTMNDVAITPIKGRGSSGVAIFDYDGDGDEDIYLTNGPGAANSLLQNQYADSGEVRFVDVGVSSGADATSQDSSGVCVGDIDNDGDADMLVLGSNDTNTLLRNNGDGTFADISALSDIGADVLGSATCSMGDVNGDGLIDIVVGNTWSSCINVAPPLGEQCGWEHQFPIFVEPYALNDHNQLFINQGDGVFADESATSGIQNTTGFSPAADGSPTISWSIALVDLDLDGDLDIVQADDQAAIPHLGQGGVDRGLLHIFHNDGTGYFTDVSASVGINKQGQWMGLAFGDLNCDGNMDIFGSNIGDYMFPVINPAYQLGESTSRWFLGNAEGGYDDLGVGQLVTTPFGWGASIIDYDNDGDQDIVFQGGLDVGPFVEASNPGAILENQGCGARFFNASRKSGSGTSHLRRNVQGMATGDLNNDGFPDMVSVSNFNLPEAPLMPAYAMWMFGGSFDGGGIVMTFQPTGPGTFEFTGIEYPDGDASIEINSGNSNGWVKVDTVGSVDVTEAGRVNRSGIGAIVTVTPDGGAPSMLPVTAGSSYSSNLSDKLSFGLAGAAKARVDVLWPGGVRNRLYGVKSGTNVRFPEIPCSIDDQEMSYGAYYSCVTSSLDDMHSEGYIDLNSRGALESSALRAWNESH